MIKKYFVELLAGVTQYEEDFYQHPGTIPGTLNIDKHACVTKISLIDYKQNNSSRTTHP